MTNLIQIDPEVDLMLNCERRADNVTYYHTAMFKHGVQGMHKIMGCPMGRGDTVEAAIADLKRRTEIESPVEITFLRRP